MAAAAVLRAGRSEPAGAVRRSTRIKPKRVIFVGAEGIGEYGFVRFLQRCWIDAGLHIHLDIKAGNGGDALSVVEDAKRYLDKRIHSKGIDERLVLLDDDRIQQDRQAGRDAFAMAHRCNIQVVLQVPNLEGLLLRLHPEQGQREVTPGSALRELRKV